MASDHAFLEALRHLLGTDGLVLPGDNADSPDLTPFLRDWRGRYVGKALAIARPRDALQVAAVVKLCASHGVSLVPQGGNTSLVGGSIPDGSGNQLLINLQRLNQVIAVDAANLSMTVQAGCLLAQVQEAASQAGLLFPLSLAAEGSCTIGGNLATNAGGTQVLRYGTARELCLGLEVVTARGEVWDGLTALRKDNSGYDLRDLFIGSEGTLGIITAATLRLFPRPVGQVTALATCPSLDACVALLQSASARLDAGLTGFEVMHAWPIALVRQYLPEQARAMAPLVNDAVETATGPVPEWTVLIDTAHAESDLAARTALEALLADAVSNGIVLDATIAQNHTQNQAMWALREAIPMAERQEGLMVKHDIALPTSAIPEFVRTTQAQLAHAFPGCKVVCFGHLGDGNLHYNVQGPPSLSSASFVADHEAEVNRLIYDTALQLGGTLSAEHGIGQLKHDELARRKSGVALGLMRAIKQALDPLGLMNPGRLISVEQPGPDDQGA